jgi:NAD(P)-dependent dehydrogenase (short-subunit alcohol dehydrogenase family)
MGTLEGRIIAVTGASSGIGRAIAVKAAESGARIVCCGRNFEKLDCVRASLLGKGHSVYLFDSGDLPSVDAMAGDIAKEVGPIGGLVHSAGKMVTALLRDAEYEVIQEIMQLNFLVFMALAKSVCRRGRYAPGMSVVGISSMAGITTAPGLSAYSASKAALNASIKSLAKEYAPRGVRFNAICPSFVNTPMIDSYRSIIGENIFKEKIEKNMPLGLIEPEDVAKSAMFFLSDESDKITGALLEITSGGGTFNSL